MEQYKTEDDSKELSDTYKYTDEELSDLAYIMSFSDYLREDDYRSMGELLALENEKD